jgi:hypothetical protein
MTATSRLLKVEDPPNSIAPFVTIPHFSKKPGTLFLDPHLTVKETVDQYRRDFHADSLEFYTMDGVKLSQQSKLEVVLGETFSVVLNGIEKFTIYFTAESFMQGPKDPEVRVLAYKYMIENGLTKDKAEALATFVHRFMREVEQIPAETLSKTMISSLYKQVILHRALEIKSRENELRSQVQILRD